MVDRRQVLGGALALAAASERAFAQPPARPFNLLILGGTGFIGPHHVRAAVARGHRVSVFNRGRSQADLPAGVEYLIGDRNNDLTSIETREWDAVLDLPAILPAWVRLSGQALAPPHEALHLHLHYRCLCAHDLGPGGRGRAASLLPRCGRPLLP